MPSGAKKLVYDSQLYWDQKSAPLPGIEPGPPGWKPEILATRPQGNERLSLYDKERDIGCCIKTKIYTFMTMIFNNTKNITLPCRESNPGRLGENQKS